VFTSLTLLGPHSAERSFMEQIVRTLQDILVRAIPTLILVIALHWYLKKVLIEPMQRVLAERRKRTEGAVEAAESAVAQAAEKMAAYEKALAEARAGIYAGQEENRKRLGTEQAAAVEAARGKAAAQVAAARVEIAAEAEAARAGLAAESDRLAEQIAQAVLAGKN
jgi:F0F1-type ATP synthase membrane subunit b/b'